MHRYPETFTCVVLDLETTGLSPKTDTIIEIAAIKITIEENGGVWKIIDRDERSMLIDPGFPISEEISLITHISNSLLQGKPRWEEVRERVREFIGNFPIVWHNVLFDIAMLKTHGIDLEGSQIIDTFELSELLSRDASSLNLWFLAKHYGYTTEKGEHRALGDTEICADLFVGYLNMLKKLDEKSLQILSLAEKIESSENISFILKMGLEYSLPPYILSEDKKSFSQRRGVSVPAEKWQKNQTTLCSFSGQEDESTFYHSVLKDTHTIHILTGSHASSEHRARTLMRQWYNCKIVHRKSSFYSTTFIEEILSKEKKVERKLAILILRILLWIEQTETGNLQELKFYGQEHTYRTFFELWPHEDTLFSQRQRDTENSILIAETRDYLSLENEIPDTLIIEEIGFFDERLRMHESTTLNFTEWKKSIETYTVDGKAKEKVLFAIEFIIMLYTQIGTQENNNHPKHSQYTETYLFDQEKLWNSGWIWLDIATKMILWAESHLEWTHKTTETELRIAKNIHTSYLEFISLYHRYTSPRRSIIIEISSWGIIARFIPQDLSIILSDFFSRESKHITYLTGYGIDGSTCLKYLKQNNLLPQEFSPYIFPWTRKNTPNIILEETLSHIDLGSSLILTTSMKHIRELGEICNRLGYHTYMQGISGGKSKIVHLYKANPEKSVIIGLLDTWRDEYQLGGCLRNIVIAKLPFDPPTDPYFIVRTTWMANNFINYSEPMVILRTNRVIWKFLSYGISGNIYTLDMRLADTEWWKNIYTELL